MERTSYYKFFQNRQCEYFPCHDGVAEEDFNCLFCYCPLYALGKACGGNCVYTYGIKDCTNCAVPHQRSNYEMILRRYEDILGVVELVDKNR